MIKRTEGEVKAYVDGYNACYEKFVEILLGRNGVNTAIRKMEMLKTAVNNVLLSEGSNLSAPESDSSNLMSQEWIPCSERLPEKMGMYLVTVYYQKHGAGVMTAWFHNNEIGWDLRVADVVTAWMPLPEPYKEEAE